MPGLKRRGLETERQTGVTVTGVAQPTGKPAEHEGPRTYHTGEATAPVPDPTQDRAHQVCRGRRGSCGEGVADMNHADWFVAVAHDEP